MNENHSLPQCAPEEQGVSSSSVLQFVEEIERNKLELHSFMFLRHGHIIAQGWWKPYQPDIPHLAYSLTKSFTSTAVGFAVQEGLLNVNDHVLSYFPEMNMPLISDNMQNLQIKHLLTMTTGHSADTAKFGVTPQFLHHRPVILVGGKEEDEYIRGFFETPLEHAPGTFFVYNSGASHVLGNIVERLTGVPLVEYLQPRLFDPLGIEKPAWDQVPNGGNIGGWGIRLKTEDLARFGQFLLNKGTWDGKRILLSAWIEEATAYHADNAVSSTKESIVDWRQGYGYQFWRCRHNAYRGDGAFGQYCLIMPDQDAVIAITGGLSDMQSVLNAVWDILLPAMKEHPIEADAFSFDLLEQKLASLELGESSSAHRKWSGTRTYHMADNEQGLQGISLTFKDDVCVLEWSDRDGAYRLTSGLNDWIVTNMADQTVSVRGGWRDSNVFYMDIYPIHSPHYDRIVFSFEDDGMRLQLQHEHLNFVHLIHEFTGTITV